MKKFLKIQLLFLALLITATAYSDPMHGLYRVGMNGDFETIPEALSALHTSGVNGPIEMKIISGTYSDQIILDSIPGISAANSITISAEFGPGYVTFTSNPCIILRGARYINFLAMDLNDILFTGDVRNIDIHHSNFKGSTIRDSAASLNTINIYETQKLKHIIFSPAVTGNGLILQHNRFNDTLGTISITNFRNISMETNVITGLYIQNSKNLKLDRNSITRSDMDDMATGPYHVLISNCDSSVISNNHFISFQLDKGLPVRLQNNVRTSFVFNNISNQGNDTCFAVHGDSIVTVRNNIINNRDYGFVVAYYGLKNFDADYNKYSHWHEATNYIRYNNVNYTSIADFTAASGMDGHSSNYQVAFAAPGDPHLNPSEAGNPELIGSPVPGITTDIDGETRNPLYPYIGADELETPLPVELASFVSYVRGNDVILEWKTYSEVNNAGFEVQRKKINQEEWMRTGYVAGNGNASTAIQYTFEDRNLEAGKYSFRLKQIDLNGNFEYFILSNEVNIGVPSVFRLSQNYPNPFNPSTIINYDIPYDGKVLIKVFDMTGKEVSTLVNEIKQAGYYEVSFNASGLSSGVYLYKIVAGNFVETKKMMLVR